MSKRIRLVISIAIVCIACIACLAALVKALGGASVPKERGRITLQGLNAPVTIGRDALGIPLIEAEGIDDLFFATGYYTASERLGQMIMMKMMIQGRMTEIGGEKFIPVDMFLRSLGARAFVEDTMKRISPRDRAFLECYARGVNAFIDTHSVFPLDVMLMGGRPEPWKAEDPVYIICALNMELSFNFIEELDFLIMASRLGYEKAAWLFPVYPDEPIPFDEAKKLSGVNPKGLNRKVMASAVLRDSLQKLIPSGIPASNNWAVSGTRTKAGKSIIANDTHLQIMAPNAWMIIHQRCPGVDVAGVTSPGIPTAVLGYNGHVAWGATMVMADSQDIFIEKIRRKGRDIEYLYRGKWLKAARTRETFVIRGGKKVHRDLHATVHGPLIQDILRELPVLGEMPIQPMPVETDYGIAMAWALGDGARTISALERMMTAANISEMRSALLDLDTMYLNILYGDGDHIAWQVTGRLPIRKKGTGFLPSPGWDGEYDWTGFAPSGSNPHGEDPATGFFATANNRTVRGHVPHISSSWYGPDRVDRVTEVVSSWKSATAEDCHRLHFDTVSISARAFQKTVYEKKFYDDILAAARGWEGARRARLKTALDMLSSPGFDCNLAATSARAALYGAFLHCAAAEIFGDEIGPAGALSWYAFADLNIMTYNALDDHLYHRHDSPFWDDIRTPSRERPPEIFARALEKAVAFCEKRMGDNRDKWQWGRLHTYSWKNQIASAAPLLGLYFNREGFPAGGDGGTVNVATPPVGEGFDVTIIPAMRLVVDFGREEPMFLVSPPGQSGIPSSPHYDDMLPYYLSGRNIVIPFGKGATARAHSRTLVLVPAKK